MPFCELVRIWTLLLSIYIDSKDLQSNFEVPAVFGSTYFWVSLYKIPTVLSLLKRLRFNVSWIMEVLEQGAKVLHRIEYIQKI